LTRRSQLKQVQPALAYATAHLDEDVSLVTLATQAGLSAFHMHRLFSVAVGETPKQLTLRLRLEHSAAMLLASDATVLDVALSTGFQSHEVFLRAFRRQFKVTPSMYRRRGFLGTAGSETAHRHAALVRSIGPCIRLFRLGDSEPLERSDMAYSVTKQDLAPQPVLLVQRRVKPSEIAAALGESLGHIFAHAQKDGIALAGQPFTRYVDWGPGLLTIEPGLPVVMAAGGRHRVDSSGRFEIFADTLPGGPVATATHVGPYDSLTEAHAAIQVWIEQHGLAAAGAPWEVYVTDPADYPDPRDWKTEVFWPLAR
jgi:AraC family transcriptional regulator